MRFVLFSVIISIFFSLYAQSYSGGTGSLGDPYQIATKSDLKYLSENSGEWNKAFIQTANINFEPSDFQSGGNFYNGGDGFIPIGNSSQHFTGSYNGDAYTISNMYISQSDEPADYLAFFGYADGATLTNITLENSVVSGNYLFEDIMMGMYEGSSYIAVLVGYASNSTTISNCSVDGTVNGYEFIGILCGMAYSASVADCSSSGVVTLNDVGYPRSAGGLIGEGRNNCSINNSSSSATVNGLTSSSNTTYCGGLVGYLGGSITSCFATGNVSGYIRIGGLVGEMAGTVSKSYATGNVDGNQRVGALVGCMITASANTENCYSTGDVSRVSGSSNEYIGGFCGLNWSGTIEHCYSIGNVSYTGTSDPTDKGFVGGTLNQNYGDPVHTFNFFDSEVSNQSTTIGAAGKTTMQMKTQATFTGWEFSTIWQINGGDGANYPDLIDNSVLPVELTAFTVSVSGGTVDLNWQTATEVNNYGFAIERRAEKGDWKEVGFVEGAGNSNVAKSYSFSDNLDHSLDHNLSYRLKQIDVDGSFEYSDEIEISSETIPTEFALEQNYPNPFNPTTTIKYAIPFASHITLHVYNLLGQEVATLVNEQQAAGNYEVKFDAGNFASGIYLYKLTAGDFSSVKKLILLK